MKAAAYLAAAALAATASADAQLLNPRDVLTRSIGIERAAPVTSVPVELKADKLFVDAVVNGETRKFIFDTGSPTILSREFADLLKLKTVARNTGVDAHGAAVTMDIAVVESLSVGGVTFHGVPVMIFNFSKLPLGPCFIDGGTIGSEIFPGSSWKIDIESRQITIAAPVAGEAEAEAGPGAALHDFGYPHAPVTEYSISRLADKALFDTGNSEPLTLFRKVFDDPAVQSSIVDGSLRKGRGSEGESAGGRGAVVDLFRFDIAGVRLGNVALPPLQATTRAAPPTLLGAGLLGSYVVTLDYPAGRIRFEPRTFPAPAKLNTGFALGIVGDHAEVTQLFKGSAAATAGLRLGDRVESVNGRSLQSSTDRQRCESAKWLAESFDASRGAAIAVIRDGMRLVIPVADSPAPRR